MLRTVTSTVLVALLITVIPACGSPPFGPQGLQPPDGFPLMPGMEPLPADDSDVAGRWRSDEFGGDVYDYYLAALPAAGYRAIEPAPGGEAAIIRFEETDGTPWQLNLTAIGGPEDGTEIKLGRPHP